MAIRAVIAGGVIVLSLAACGGEDTSGTPTTVVATAPTAVPHPSAMTSATVAELTIEAAGEQYLRVVAPATCAADQLNAALDSAKNAAGSDVMDIVVPLYRAAARAFSQLAADLRAKQWPATLSVDMETLADAAANRSLALRSAANAQSLAEQQAIVNSDNFIQTAAAADATAATVREKLGLDSTDDTDFCALAGT